MNNPEPDSEPTNGEILDAINSFATKTEQRFQGIEGRFEGIDGRLQGIDEHFQGIEQHLTRIEANMVTKSYLDEKIGDLRGDMVQLVRKEDGKVNAVVDALDEEKILPHQRVEVIRSHHVFPAPPSVSTSPA